MSERAMQTMHRDVRMLIALRVVVVTTLLLAVLIIQFSVDAADDAIVILPVSYLYMTTALVYALTLGYIAMARLVANRTLNLYVQFSGDVIVETLLVYFTGGADSPFSFLYLVSIITASMMLYRRGGLIVASSCVILYGALIDLLYYGLLPQSPYRLFTPTPWSSVRLYVNMATNFAGFYATAFLTSYIAEKLRQTSRELDANRQNLAQLRALNQNVVQSVPSGLITLTRQGWISFVNPAALAMLQKDPAALIGRDLVEIGLFERDEWNEILKQVDRNRIVRGERSGIEVGRMKSFGYAVTPLSTIEGEHYGLTIIFQDLTEMKQLESELRLKDRMAAVGELSAGIAHEIRNPLAAIAGSVQVLRNSQNLSPQEQRLMSIILKESDRLNKTIADFLRFVRPQERQAEIFDIAAALSETLDLFRNSTEVDPRHRIEATIEPASFELEGDVDQIRQVFWNILRNAVRAMPEGGRLVVTASPDEDDYAITFTDEGRGMTEEQQRDLFQPFRTDSPSGTGLGMAISYRIIQAHDGDIRVVSQLGAGTSITIILPVHRQARKRREPALTLAAARGAAER